jgi:hypothetical protein
MDRSGILGKKGRRWVTSVKISFDLDTTYQGFYQVRQGRIVPGLGSTSVTSPHNNPTILTFFKTPTCKFQHSSYFF